MVVARFDRPLKHLAGIVALQGLLDALPRRCVLSPRRLSLQFSVFELRAHILEDTSSRNPREVLLEKKNAPDSVTIPPSLPRSRGRQGRTSESSCNFMHATNYVLHHERSDVVDNENHVLERASSLMCAPHKPQGVAHGVETKEI